MLVYGTHENDSVIIGDADTLMMQATAEDRLGIARMLVASDPDLRRLGQRLADRLGVMGTVQNTEQRSETTRLGFTFPKEIPVDRESIRALVDRYGRQNVRKTAKAVQA